MSLKIYTNTPLVPVWVELWPVSVYTGCRIGLYEWIRESILGRNADGTYTFW